MMRHRNVESCLIPQLSKHCRHLRAANTSLLRRVSHWQMHVTSQILVASRMEAYRVNPVSPSIPGLTRTAPNTLDGRLTDERNPHEVEKRAKREKKENQKRKAEL